MRSLEEFLRFKGKDIALLKKDADIWKHGIKVELEKYVLCVVHQCLYDNPKILLIIVNNSNIIINTVETGGLNVRLFFIGICQEDVGKNPS